MSLSKNELNDFSLTPIDLRGSHKSIKLPERQYLTPEYLLGAGGSDAFYVENSGKDFSRARRIIRQDENGNASLDTPAISGGIDTETLSTILTDDIAEILHNKGLDKFLSLETQQLVDVDGDRFDFDGAYGQYYWEMFFHIPFLIAKHLNANQKFKEARWWYERIFNPAAPKDPGDSGSTNHFWRFREFRNRDVDTLRDIVTDEAAIAAYNDDPFEPHAIARLRNSAYQKAVVTAYVKNLTDWGDVLFARDSRESVSEASILYALAREVLGKRPVEVGDCKTEETLNFDAVKEALAEGSEFLILLENLAINRRNHLEFSVRPVRAAKAVKASVRASNPQSAPRRLEEIREAVSVRDLGDELALMRETMKDDEVTQLTFDNGEVMSAAEAVRRDRISFTMPFGQASARAHSGGNDVVPYGDGVGDRERNIDRIASVLGIEGKALINEMVLDPHTSPPAADLTRDAVAAFCVPHNPNLLDHWDRIDIQLNKIRNCQNIDGEVRKLPLIEQPINVELFLGERAAGLSLEEIAAIAFDQETPAYRFTALLPVAKQAAQMVQGLGQSLLSALEKKDAEELRRLQLTHETNLQNLTSSIKKQQVDEAERQLDAAKASLSRSETNLKHYTDLIETGLTAGELAEQTGTHIATGFKIAENRFRLAAGLIHLIPRIGSPLAFLFGGKEKGDSMGEFAGLASSNAALASQIAQSAGLEARWQRREQDWKHQRDLARKDLTGQTASHAAAKIRHELAEKDLEIHDKALEQTADIVDFHEGKFTNEQLYTHLASTLTRFYRDAYMVAQDLAKRAERAYAFETNRESSFVTGDHWETASAGLLAGEQLTVQLAAMEAEYLHVNTRRPEIQQTFSLAMLDGQELINLRQTGTCKISIPEIAFEVLYPGQYRRLIKAVRVSIPAVVGPYTNVSAKLTLEGSKVRANSDSGTANLDDGPTPAANSISLSGAVNDSGMFEFAYRDERYLPFEGAGAVSEWTLELPKSVRSFDYDTIADVLFHLDYTAMDGDREAAEGVLTQEIVGHANGAGLYRLISLRHEFPDVWARLIAAADGAAQDLDFTLTDAHFPHLFHNREVTISDTTDTIVYLRPEPGEIVDPPTLRLDNTPITWGAHDIARSGIPGDTDQKDMLRGGTAAFTGEAKRAKRVWKFDGGEGAIDPATTADLMILIRYTVDMD